MRRPGAARAAGLSRSITRIHRNSTTLANITALGNVTAMENFTTLASPNGTAHSNVMILTKR